MSSEEYLEAVEAANASGKLKKGVNEVTKALERGVAKLVVVASDVSPKEIIMHLPILAKEKGVQYGEVASKEELGAAAGLQRPTSAVAVLEKGGEGKKGKAQRDEESEAESDKIIGKEKAQKEKQKTKKKE